MSRRHHGRPHHPAHGGANQGRPATGVTPSPAGSGPERNGHLNQGQGPVVGGSVDPVRAERASSAQPTTGGPVRASGMTPNAGHGTPANGASPVPFRPGGASQQGGAPQQNGAPMANGGTHPHGQGGSGQDHSGGSDRNGQCTAPQLRRFIKSRPYVPMHELRRRFGIDGADDDVTPVRLDPGWVYVGLPSREGSLLGDLLRAGEIGYELSLDPRTPIVIGVYPMRPIPRS